MFIITSETSLLWIKRDCSRQDNCRSTRLKWKNEKLFLQLGLLWNELMNCKRFALGCYSVAFCGYFYHFLIFLPMYLVQKTMSEWHSFLVVFLCWLINQSDADNNHCSSSNDNQWHYSLHSFVFLWCQFSLYIIIDFSF